MEQNPPVKKVAKKKVLAKKVAKKMATKKPMARKPTPGAGSGVGAPPRDPAGSGVDAGALDPNESSSVDEEGVKGKGKGKKGKVKDEKKSQDQVILAIRDEMLGLEQDWLVAKEQLMKAFLGQEEITDEDEAKFLEMKTALLRKAKRLDKQTQVYLDVGLGQIEKILKSAVNLRTVKDLNQIAKKGLYATWHVGRLNMLRTIGALDSFGEGFRPRKTKKKKTAMDKFADSLKMVVGSKVDDDGESKGENPIKALIMVIGGLAAAGLLIWIALTQIPQDEEEDSSTSYLHQASETHIARAAESHDAHEYHVEELRWS